MECVLRFEVPFLKMQNVFSCCYKD